MPIEDLDYLYKNSTQENIIILVDSHKRNRIHWPSSNTFQIDFNEPFKYVYGVDIMDISIPRTMYSIDENKKRLVLKMGVFKTIEEILATERDIVVDFVTRDYTVRELLEEMGAEESPLFLNNISVSVNANISERKSIIEYINMEQPSKPFVIDMQKSTMNEVLGFNEIAKKYDSDKYMKVSHPTNQYLFASVPKYLEILMRNPQWSMSNNVFEFNQMNIESTSTSSVVDEFNQGILSTNLNEENYKYQGYYVTNITLSNVDDYDQTEPVDFYLYKLDYSQGFPVGTTKEDVVDLFNNTVVDKKDIEKIIQYSQHVSSSNIELVYKDTFQKIGDHLVFDIDKAQEFPYYFKSIPIMVVGNIFYLVYLDIPVLATTSLSTSVDVDVIEEFRLVSPGLVQLSGERYITVHCDEIENHLRGSMMFNNYSPGLAMVNLGVQGFSENRVDFFSVKYKEFHPIGKLTGLKFSLKTPDGDLYDLKHVNWHMLVSIKYYVPKKQEMFEKSTLNPNYNYNFLQYQIDKKEASESSSSEDEDDFDESDYNMYKRKEMEVKEKLLETLQTESEDSDSDDEDI